MNPTSEEDESGTTEQNEDSENVDIKQKIEAYGIGVRGGTITPQEDDEKYFRESLELPNPNPAVQEAWQQDGGARRPVTLKSQDAFKEEQNQIVEDIDSDTPKEE